MAWPGLAAIGKVSRQRETNGTISHETAYYLLSNTLAPVRFAEVVRAHWGIENSLHWVLDVTMNEDQNRSRKNNGPQNHQGKAQARRLERQIPRYSLSPPEPSAIARKG
jgi:predicted transposase YbfD/YdcC